MRSRDNGARGTRRVGAAPRSRRRAGAARRPRGGAAARPDGHRRRPRPLRTGLPLRRPARHRLDRGRARDRPPRQAERVDGIIAPGTDHAVATAARIAERLALPHPITPGDRGPRRARGSGSGSCSTAPASRSRARSSAGRSTEVTDAAADARVPGRRRGADRAGERGVALRSEPRCARRGRVRRARRSRAGSTASSRRSFAGRSGDGERVLARRALRAAHRDRPRAGPAAGVRRSACTSLARGARARSRSEPRSRPLPLPRARSASSTGRRRRRSFSASDGRAAREALRTRWRRARRRALPRRARRRRERARRRCRARRGRARARARADRVASAAPAFASSSRRQASCGRCAGSSARPPSKACAASASTASRVMSFTSCAAHPTARARSSRRATRVRTRSRLPTTRPRRIGFVGRIREGRSREAGVPPRGSDAPRHRALHRVHRLEDRPRARRFTCSRTRTPAWWLASLAIMVGSVWPMAWRWQRLLAARGVHDSLRWLVRSYFVGYAAGQVLPTSLGGDASRIYETSRRHEGTSGAAAGTVLLERALGGTCDARARRCRVRARGRPLRRRRLSLGRARVRRRRRRARRRCSSRPGCTGCLQRSRPLLRLPADRAAAARGLPRGALVPNDAAAACCRCSR